MDPLADLGDLFSLRILLVPVGPSDAEGFAARCGVVQRVVDVALVGQQAGAQHRFRPRFFTAEPTRDWHDLQFNSRVLGIVGVVSCDLDKLHDLSGLDTDLEALRLKFPSVVAGALLGFGTTVPDEKPAGLKCLRLGEDGQAAADGGEVHSVVQELVAAILRSLKALATATARERGVLFRAPHEASGAFVKSYSKRATGRMEKCLGDIAACSHQVAIARQHYTAAFKAQKDANDWCWLASTCEALAWVALEECEGGEGQCGEEVTARYREALSYYNKVKEAAIPRLEALCRLLKLHARLGQRDQVLLDLQENLDDRALSVTDRLCLRLQVASVCQAAGITRKASFFMRLAGLCHLKLGAWGSAYDLLSFSSAAHSMASLPGYLANPLNGAGSHTRPSPGRRQTGQVVGWAELQAVTLMDLAQTSRRLGNGDVKLPYVVAYFCHHVVEPAGRTMLPVLLAELTNIKPSNISPHGLEGVPALSRFTACKLPAHREPTLQAPATPAVASSPFIYSPIRATMDMVETVTWVADEVCEATVLVSNPLPFDVKISSASLVVASPGFIPLTSNPFVLPANCQGHCLRLLGKPTQTGEVLLTGCSITTFGVTSQHTLACPQLISVIDRVPLLAVRCNLIATSSGKLSMFLGQRSDMRLLVANEGSVTARTFQLSLASLGEPRRAVTLGGAMDKGARQEVEFEGFRLAMADLQAGFPLEPGATFEVPMTIAASTTSQQGVSIALEYSSSWGAFSVGAPPPQRDLATVRSSDSGQSTPSTATAPAAVYSRTASLRLPLSVVPGVKLYNFDVLLQPPDMAGRTDAPPAPRPGHDDSLVAIDELLSPSSLNSSLDSRRMSEVYNTECDGAAAASSRYEEGDDMCLLVLDCQNDTKHAFLLTFLYRTAVIRQVLVQAYWVARVYLPLPCFRLSAEEVAQPVPGAAPGMSADDRALFWYSHRLRSLVTVEWSQFSFRNQGTIELPQKVLSLQTLGRLQPRVLHISHTLQGSQGVAYGALFECTCNSLVELTVSIQNAAETAIGPFQFGVRIMQDTETGEQVAHLGDRVAFVGRPLIDIPGLAAEATLDHSVGVIVLAPGAYRLTLVCFVDGDEALTAALARGLSFVETNGSEHHISTSARPISIVATAE